MCLYLTRLPPDNADHVRILRYCQALPGYRQLRFHHKTFATNVYHFAFVDFDDDESGGNAMTPLEQWLQRTFHSGIQVFVSVNPRPPEVLRRDEAFERLRAHSTRRFDDRPPYQDFDDENSRRRPPQRPSQHSPDADQDERGRRWQRPNSPPDSGANQFDVPYGAQEPFVEMGSDDEGPRNPPMPPATWSFGFNAGDPDEDGTVDLYLSWIDPRYSDGNLTMHHVHVDVLATIIDGAFAVLQPNVRRMGRPYERQRRTLLWTQNQRNLRGPHS